MAGCLAAAAPAGAAPEAEKRPRAPRAVLGGAPGVGLTGATVRARVRPGGKRTTWRVEYGTSARLPLRSAPRVLPRGGRARRVRVRLRRLEPETTYRYRVAATICGWCPRGTVRSRVRRFRTRDRVIPPARDPVAPLPASAGGSFSNPVGGAIADPMVLRDAGIYYAYGTGPEVFPVMRSTDLVRWDYVGSALPERPRWVSADDDWRPWAPSVVRTPRPCPGGGESPCFLLYYTGVHASLSPSASCVAVAVSGSPVGPFRDLGPIRAAGGRVDNSDRPPGCGDDRGYDTIDPAPFVDTDGRAYLYVATNRPCERPAPYRICGFRPTLSVIPLSRDLLRAAGPRVALLSGEPVGWEAASPFGPTLENPWLEKRGRTYHLLYSGGDYRGGYGMGYATARRPTGPFTKSAANPILREGGSDAISVGGGSVVEGPRGGDWLVYHARSGDYEAPRTLRVDQLIWNGEGSIGVSGPSTGPAAPSP